MEYCIESHCGMDRQRVVDMNCDEVVISRVRSASTRAIPTEFAYLLFAPGANVGSVVKIREGLDWRHNTASVYAFLSDGSNVVLIELLATSAG